MFLGWFPLKQWIISKPFGFGFVITDSEELTSSWLSSLQLLLRHWDESCETYSWQWTTSSRESTTLTWQSARLSWQWLQPLSQSPGHYHGSRPYFHGVHPHYYVKHPYYHGNRPHYHGNRTDYYDSDKPYHRVCWRKTVSCHQNRSFTESARRNHKWNGCLHVHQSQS